MSVQRWSDNLHRHWSNKRCTPLCPIFTDMHASKKQCHEFRQAQGARPNVCPCSLRFSACDELLWHISLNQAGYPNPYRCSIYHSIFRHLKISRSHTLANMNKLKILLQADDLQRLTMLEHQHWQATTPSQLVRNFS